MAASRNPDKPLKAYLHIYCKRSENITFELVEYLPPPQYVHY